MNQIIRQSEFWTRESVSSNQDCTYIFGDNVAGTGMGGQACIRGLSNAYGIPTLAAPGEFWNDDTYEANIEHIKAAVAKIPRGKPWVFSADGLGTGIAQLDVRAPRTFEFLKTWMDKMFEAGGVVSPPGVYVKGYKATNKSMVCQPPGTKPFQYVLGEWAEHSGVLRECGSGLHFCQFPSGVWAYYPVCSETRVFECEAEFVLEVPDSPGADKKLVASRIRLVKELLVGGNRNSGNGNSGYGNSGYGNSGNRNSGNRNSGNGNSGYGNSGYGNSGNRNSGNRNSGNGNSGNGNSGDGNSGYGNSGNGNSGYGNSGYGNSGYGNSGYGNSGYGNATDRSSDIFCADAPTVRFFDRSTKLTYEEAFAQHGSTIYSLGEALLRDDVAPDFDRYKNLPNITAKKLQALWEKHIAVRKAIQEKAGR